MVQCSFCSGSGVSMGGPGDGFSGLSGIINNGGIRKAVTE